VDLRRFSPSQRQIVEAGDGPLSVLAGPGSGKTTVLAGRIAYLVEQRGVPPAAILAITFTTAAAATLRQRLAGVLGDAAQDLTITTFHALGLRLIRQWSQELGFVNSAPAVFGREDARSLLREVAGEFGLEIAAEVPGRASDPWAVSLSRLSSAVDRHRLGSVKRSHGDNENGEFDEELLRPLADAYESLLRRRGAVDYPSMLTLPLQLFATEPRTLQLVQDAYRWVLADEFQDTSKTQYALLQKVVEPHHNLAVVGDPKQAVFGWLGADPSLLLEFPRQYPEARVFPLDQNHRSTGIVVALSNAIAAPLKGGRESWTGNAQGPRARLYAAADENDEARFVAAEIGGLLGTRQIEHAGEVGVLYRTNAQARAVALALRTAGLPFRVRADADLFGGPEVRDLVAYLRLAHCPSDGPALARVVNTPPRRLRAIERALRKRPVPAAELPVWAAKLGGAPARHRLEQFLALLQDLHDSTLGSSPVQALECVLLQTGYPEWLTAQKDRASRLRRTEEFRAVLAESPAPDLATWLTDMHLGQIDGHAPTGAGSTVLSTIHSAKGAEWPVVFVIGLEDGLLPHTRPGSPGASHQQEDEERRLAYVAFSRAQVLLYLVYCRSRQLATDGEVGRVEPRRPSRFMLSLPPELVERVNAGRAA